MKPVASIIAASVLLVACRTGQTQDPASTKDQATREDTAAIVEALRPGNFDEALKLVAKAYRRWERVSDRMEWSPWMCRALTPAGALESQSKDEDTHGRKLYHLFAAPTSEYPDGPARWVDLNSPNMGDPQLRESPKFAPGTAVVKETWTPLEVPISDVPKKSGATVGDRGHPAEHLVAGGKAWKMDEQKDLFIMLRAGDTKMEGTDEGWVYGVVSPDGSTVHAAGRIENCMGCHKEARFERLFGPAWTRGLARESTQEK